MFQALYRKYRPQTFADIVGQNHIVSVLKNAIDKDQISHAYLFYGSRGTGKTSIAKIFANEVNKNEEYQKENVDIIEIDAASNNGVDEVRDIKEAIKFLPTEGKYKVYIIDEVHMLTTAAFNALLKTLEEPPAHVIFILATTEIHKIPATILSRCQRFEFKNLSQEQLIDRLKYISEKESLVIEDAAIEKIATLAKGGLRDAISILDQVSNYSEEITLNHILEVTSSISEDDILVFYRNLLQGDVTKSLLTYNNFVSQAKDTKLLLNDLINVTRDVVVYKNLKDTKHTAYNIEKNVRFLGYQPRESLREIMKDWDFYIQASVCEGHPNAIGESLQCGTGFISSKTGFIAETLQEQFKEFFFENFDPEVMANNLKALCCMPNLAERYQEAIGILKNNCAKEKIVREWLGLMSYSKSPQRDLDIENIVCVGLHDVMGNIHDSITTPINVFRNFVEYVAGKGYGICSMQNYLTKGKEERKKWIVCTFDDG